MFLEYFGLNEQPFGVTPDPRFLYLAPAQQEAFSSLLYGVQSGRGFVALIASPGSGKTTVLFRLMERLQETARTAFLFQTQATSLEFLRNLLEDLDIEATGRNLSELQKQLADALLKEAQAGRRVVVAIDEAQNLADDILEMVRMLSNFETPQAKLLQVVLAGQPQLADKLAAPHMEQLRQRVSIIAQFPPLADRDVAPYIHHRLRVAGYKGGRIFSAAALRLIVSYGKGIPRNINNLCFHAFSLAYAKKQKTIGEAILEEVIADLSLEPFLAAAQKTPVRPRAPAAEPAPAPTHASNPAPVPPVAAKPAPVPPPAPHTPAVPAAEADTAYESVSRSQGEPESPRPSAMASAVEAARIAPEERSPLDAVDIGSPARPQGATRRAGRAVRSHGYGRAIASRRSHDIGPYVALALALLCAVLWYSEPRLTFDYLEHLMDSFGNNNVPPAVATNGAVARPAPVMNLPNTQPRDGVAATAEPQSNGAQRPIPEVPGVNYGSDDSSGPAPPALVHPQPSQPQFERSSDNDEPPTASNERVPASGRLIVESSSAGAQISINGVSDPKWRTPRSFALPAGSYLVTVSSGTSLPWARRVQVAQGRDHFVKAELEGRDGGIFAVDTDPPGMQVFIDHKPYGRSRVDTVLRPGWHECEVIPAPGMAPLVARFHLNPGEAVTRRIRMNTPPASIVNAADYRRTPTAPLTSTPGGPQ